MSKASCLAGWVIITGIAAAMPARAQDVRMLSQRAEREAAAARRASEAADAFDKPSRSFAAVADTFRIGNGAITVLAKPDVAALAKEASARTDTLLAQVPTAVAAIRGSVAYVELDTIARRYRVTAGPAVVMRFGVPPALGAVRSEAGVNVDQLSRLLEGTAMNRALDKINSPFTKWRSGNLPLRRDDLGIETDWSTVRFEMLASRSLLGGRCYRGEIASCSMLLGLTQVDDPVMAWYDSLARFDEVTEHKNWALRSDREGTEACLRGDDAECGRVLHVINRFEVPPAGGIVRTALTAEAIRMGGAGAIERMLASRGTPSEALAAGAGAPVDSVIRVWYSHVRGGSLGSRDLSWWMIIVSIGWVALLFALSTRISRWR